MDKIATFKNLRNINAPELVDVTDVYQHKNGLFSMAVNGVMQYKGLTTYGLIRHLTQINTANMMDVYSLLGRK